MSHLSFLIKEVVALFLNVGKSLIQKPSPVPWSCSAARCSRTPPCLGRLGAPVTAFLSLQLLTGWIRAHKEPEDDKETTIPTLFLVTLNGKIQINSHTPRNERLKPQQKAAFRTAWNWFGSSATHLAVWPAFTSQPISVRPLLESQPITLTTINKPQWQPINSPTE